MQIKEEILLNLILWSLVKTSGTLVFVALAMLIFLFLCFVCLNIFMLLVKEFNKIFGEGKNKRG